MPNMTMTDPIADMLTRLRNANSAYHDQVSMPSSKIKTHICEILKQEGYIASWKVEDAEVGKSLTIELKDVDSRLVPGMRANFHVDAPQADNVVLVPNSAIHDGCVWIKTREGQKEKRTVVTGKIHCRTTSSRSEIRALVNGISSVFGGIVIHGKV